MEAADPIERDHYLEAAAAVLAAMREPSEAMEITAIKLGPDMHPTEYWQAMIDAA